MSSFILSKHEQYRVHFHWTHEIKRWSTLSRKEPLLSQVHKTCENGLIAWWDTMSVCYPLWTRKNKKRHSSFVMGKLREMEMFFICIYGSLQSTFEHGTCLDLHIWTVGYSSCHRVNPLLWVTQLLWFNSKNSSSYSLHYTWFQSRQFSASKSFVVLQIVQRMSLPKNNSSITLPIHKFSHV